MKWYQYATVGLACTALLTTPVWAKHDAKKKHQQKHEQSLMLKLYQKPDQSSTVVHKIKLNQLGDYVPFHQNDQWIKVGNSDSGQVGWINKHAYKKLIHKASQPQVFTQYVYSTEKNGKPIIRAYQNGKKLSKQEAKDIYNKMQKQMKQQQKQFKQQWQQFNKQFQQLNEQFNKMFHSSSLQMSVPFKIKS